MILPLEQNCVFRDLETTLESSIALYYNYLWILFLATTSFTHTRIRQEVISFSLPLTFSSFGVFIKNPANIFNYTAYLETLTYWSWLAILVFLMFISISLYAIMRLAEGSLRISFGQNFEAVFRALLLLDSQFALSKTSTRFIFTVYVWIQGRII